MPTVALVRLDFGYQKEQKKYAVWTSLKNPLKMRRKMRNATIVLMSAMRWESRKHLSTLDQRRLETRCVNRRSSKNRM